MIISGGNLEACEVEYKKLTEWGYIPKEPYASIIKYLENLYLDILIKARDIVVNEFPCNGKHVCISPGMINHKCINSLEMLEGISKYGILASEWFGQLESEQEGRFCAFVDRIKPDNFGNQEKNISNSKNDNYFISNTGAKEKVYVDTYTAPKTYNGFPNLENYKRLNIGDNAILFVDSENEIMQQLLHLDYFEYEGIKKINPGSIEQLYTKEEFYLLELIEALSPAGKDYRDKKESIYYYWSAIPGGIPAQLINEICLTNSNQSVEYIDKLSKLFPNATIFNGELKILYKPQKVQTDNKKFK